MVDVAVQPNSVGAAQPARKRSSLRIALKRKSTAAFLMTLPLILLIAILVHLSRRSIRCIWRR